MAWSAGLTAAVLLALGVALYIGVQASLGAASQAQLAAQADGVSRFIERVGAGGLHEPHEHGADEPPLGSPEFGGPGAGTISYLVDGQGQFAGGSPADETDLPVADGVTAALAGATDVRLETVDGSPVRVLSERIEIDGEPYVIQVVGDRAAEQRTLNTLLLVLLVGGLVALGLAAGVGFLYAGNALVPIRESLRRQREFAADASHELRTPLTIVRGNVERLRRDPEPPKEERREALDDIEVEVDHLTGLVDDLLLLARSDSGTVDLRRDPVDLADVAGEALQRLRPMAESRRRVPEPRRSTSQSDRRRRPASPAGGDPRRQRDPAFVAGRHGPGFDIAGGPTQHPCRRRGTGHQAGGPAKRLRAVLSRE